MPKVNAYEGKIPAFYRKRTLDVMLFTHVTVLHEKCDMQLEDAVRDFLDFYCIDEEDYSVRSALVTYNRVRNNFIWANLKQRLDNKSK